MCANCTLILLQHVSAMQDRVRGIYIYTGFPYVCNKLQISYHIVKNSITLFLYY
jgi:hypothetical protein